ncbi:MAG: branched-chain amino acid ABC transporter permease [Deltaproteobacteria bacterium]|nr:branched-chain amino acid ABC transporter permease [Deltaproteobacteria bacterium]MBW1847114.1 branched-chain amino acid ABC transporter permease [Deltaproteobacteria bacterium]MBW1983787.1 branched-chain amino acid ABC transporter permease [Deltaproteobacteria bacterium]MBW2179735.1 branched-chain amino acid ABC transporter permease [Deltaproteobacteria bacterium]MBW2364580.1 branched-chain amino acid ABC transporter permease [Deltaproteobacteria bacterium]
MPFEIFVQLAISGLTTGAIYSLIALGFITIYRASNILNLAQGEFVMLGALCAVFFIEKLGFSYFPAAVTSIFLVSMAGLFLQRAVIHPIRDEPVLILIMVTIGLSIFMSGSAGILFGPSPRSLPPFIDAPSFEIFNSVRINTQSFFVIGATLLLVIILYMVSRYTFIGKAMEAVSTDRLGSDLTGIPGNFIVMLSFGISAGIGAIAGIFITPLFFTQYNSGAILGLKGFSAAVIGGWGKYSGAVLGGLILGVVESVSVGFIPAGYKDAIAFIVLLLILYFKPKGILGSRALEESRK